MSAPTICYQFNNIGEFCGTNGNQVYFILSLPASESFQLYFRYTLSTGGSGNGVVQFSQGSNVSSVFTLPNNNTCFSTISITSSLIIGKDTYVFTNECSVEPGVTPTPTRTPQIIEKVTICGTFTEVLETESQSQTSTFTIQMDSLGDWNGHYYFSYLNSDGTIRYIIWSERNRWEIVDFFDPNLNIVGNVLGYLYNDDVLPVNTRQTPWNMTNKGWSTRIIKGPCPIQPTTTPTTTPTRTQTPTKTPTPGLTRTPTMTRTATLGVSSTPSATSTKTPTRTPTPTKTSCACYVYAVTITQQDLNLSTGNQIHPNGVVSIYDIVTCDGTACHLDFTSAGTYYYCIPSSNPQLGFFHVYQNDESVCEGLTSTIVNTNNCCGVTPTPTKTQTPTPTKTPTPSSYTFVDCCNGTVFTIFDVPPQNIPTLGSTYYIFAQGYRGCATNIRDLSQSDLVAYSYQSLTLYKNCDECASQYPCPSNTPLPSLTPTTTPTKTKTPTPSITTTLTPGITKTTTPTITKTPTVTPTQCRCVRVSSECAGYQGVPTIVGPTINGYPSYQFTFPNISNENYRIQWDSTRNQWVTYSPIQNKFGMYLPNVGPNSLPIGNISQWINIVPSPIGSVNCITDDVAFFTYCGQCAAPSPTPTSTNTPTPTLTPTITVTPSPCICPSGYFPLPNYGGCYTITTTPATQTGNLLAGTGDNNSAYGDFGVRIYNLNGYDQQGNVIGTYAYDGEDFSQNPPPNISFWMGRMNANNIWVTGNPNWPGEPYPGSVSMCATINIPTSKVYYIGIAGDNDVSIQVNNSFIMAQPNDQRNTNFKYWHIYPVLLTAGPNVIQMIGTNRSSVGGFAAEIYDNTLQQLTAATSTTDINIVFTTGDYRQGGPLFNQGFCSNFTCPNGFQYDPVLQTCVRRDIIPCGASPSPTPTQTPTITLTSSPGTSPTPTPTTTLTSTITQTPTITPSPELLNPCVQCNLGFDAFQTQSFGQPYIGNLTGSCANITDYKINWYYSPTSPNNIYDPNNPTQNLVFNTGNGSLFAPFDYRHPLTGTQTPIVLPGYYYPVIDRLKLGSAIYSTTGGTGTIQTNLDCLFPTIVISAYTCSYVNTQPGDSYNTFAQFTTDGQLTTQPATLSTVIRLEPTTNFIAFLFEGFSIPDTFDIKYSGSSYPVLLTLESLKIGTQNNYNDFSINLMPKTFWASFQKVICLTGLTRSSDDFLILSVIPNPQNNATSWKVKWKCLDTFDCEPCLIQNFRNQPAKIIESSLSATTGSCLSFNFKYSFSACSQSQIYTTDVYNYFYNWFGFVRGSSQIYQRNLSFNGPGYYCSNNGRYIDNSAFPVCSPDQGSGTIITEVSNINNTKTLTITCSRKSDFDAFFNTYLACMVYSGTPSDNTLISYYRYITLRVSKVQNNTLCGDASTIDYFYIHTSSVVTTAQTATDWVMSMTLPSITRNITFPACTTYCDGDVDSVVNLVNITANKPNYLNINNVGARLQTPFYYIPIYLFNSNPQGVRTGENLAWIIQPYSNETYVFSGASPTYTILPALSAKTCNNFAPPLPFLGHYFNVSSITVEPQPTNYSNYDISASTNSNFNAVVPQTLIYRYSGGTVLYKDTNFFT